MKTFVYAFFLLFLCVSFSPKEPLSDEVCLTAEEKKMYDLIMQYRRSKKLSTIPLSAKLSQVAQVHARDLAENYTFDPESNKCNPHTWSDQGNWTSCCYTDDHKEAKCMWNKPKEIAGYPTAGYEMAYFSSAGATAKEGVDGWKLSPGHNAMMINLGSTWSKTKWQAIGIGIYQEYGIVWFGETKDEIAPRNCK